MAAIIISLGTAAWIFTHDPLGAGLDSYDHTTPKNALISILDMSINGDMRAFIEIDRLKNERTSREKRDTIKVHKDSNYQGKKILFVSYKEDGILKHDIASFEKDVDSGYWFPSDVSTYGMDDDALKKAIKEWRNRTDADGE